jgi:S-adenosylmethionine hydrolase
MPIITLTTDFGTRDGYVGAVKGVLTWHAPGATIIDLAHDIPRGDIAHAAWVIATACNEFPQGAVHMVVVDPGVGGARAGAMVYSRGHVYVGPDNGVFAYIPYTIGFAIVPGMVAATVKAGRGAGEPSPTFHGRDLFAPVAAALARGEPPDALGFPRQLRGTLPWGPRPAGEGRVVHIDNFGNLISDLPRAEAGNAVAIAGRRLNIVRTYENAAPGDVLAYIGSADTVEVAVRDGRADAVLEAPRGTRIIPVTDVEPYR